MTYKEFNEMANRLAHYLSINYQIKPEEKVAVVPGTAFGKEFGSFVRVSYANSLENLREAVIRIERFLSRRCAMGGL